jgi:hypothetical protein
LAFDTSWCNGNADDYSFFWVLRKIFGPEREEITEGMEETE